MYNSWSLRKWKYNYTVHGIAHFCLLSARSGNIRRSYSSTSLVIILWHWKLVIYFICSISSLLFYCTYKSCACMLFSLLAIVLFCCYSSVFEFYRQVLPTDMFLGYCRLMMSERLVGRKKTDMASTQIDQKMSRHVLSRHRLRHSTD